MGVIMVLIASLMWSFVGVLVKQASTMVGSTTITLSRFLFGAIFLGLFLYIRDKKINFKYNSKWIWFAALAKSINYIFENIGISLGYAYSNILVLPIQGLFLVLISALYLKEKVSLRKWISALICLFGVFIVSWNGLPLKVLFERNIFITLLFVISGIGAGAFIFGQKMLIDSMESAHMNFSVFLLSTIIVAVPVPFTFEFNGFGILPLLALIFLGLITGLSFYIYANALKKVPFLIAAIISNTSVLFTLLWSYLFYREPITPYIIAGTFMFVIGIILLNTKESSISKKIRNPIRFNSLR